MNHGLLRLTLNNDMIVTEECLNLWGDTFPPALVAAAVNDPLCDKFMTFHTENVVSWWSELMEQCVTTSNIGSRVLKRRYVKYRCHLE
jgi:hypothetical protein